MTTPIKIKIVLQDLPHQCERTLLVPENVNMLQLHFIIQEAFGWESAHLFEFKNKRFDPTISAGIPDDFDMGFGSQTLVDAGKAKLKKLFLEQNNAKPFLYLYDFGDSWQHRLSFLKVTKKDLQSYDGTPICLKVIGKCPPEDVGGAWGYADFLDTIKDKKHPEHEEMKDWFGIDNHESYDYEEVNLEAINQRLHSYFKSKQWKAKSMDE